MTADAECISCVVDALKSLGLTDIKVRINNRKILNVFLSSIGLKSEYEAILRAIDKLDKIGENGIKRELLNITSIDKINQIVSFLQGKVKIPGDKGLDELKEIQRLLQIMKIDADVKIDYSLVRGLGYYSGPIVEFMFGDYNKSVAGGGRYDQLISTYGQDLPATGLSIGVERIVNILDELNL